MITISILAAVYLTFLLFVFLFGICIGSFLNVCIWRIPERISVVKGRSFCPCCGRQLKALDMIPLLSYMMLRGRCRYCKAPVSARYPVVEGLNGVLYVLIFYFYGLRPFSIVAALFFSILIVIFFIDLEKGIIPDRLIICITLLTPLYLYFSPSPFSLWSSLGGLLLVSLPMLAMALLFGGFGGGDIKLMAVCGFMLGTELTAVTAFIAILSAAAYSVVLLLRKKAQASSAIPFGPFLCAGMVLSIFLGSFLTDWYLSILF